MENRDYGYGNYKDAEFYSYPYHIKGVSEDHTYSSLSYCLDEYQYITFSFFGSNFNRALGCLLSQSSFQSEVITLCGYVIDFEVLIGPHNRAINSLHFLRYRSSMDGLRGIGALPHIEGYIDESTLKSDMLPLIDTLKDCEKVGKGGDVCTPEVIKLSGLFVVVVFNNIIIFGL